MELWIINGGYFKLPYYVEIQDDVALLDEAVPMLGAWFEAAGDLLRPRGAMRSGKWAIPRHELINIAERAAPGTKPEDHVVWAPHRARQPRTIPVEIPMQLSKDADDFVRKFVQDTGLVPLHTMQMIWHAMGIKILDYMVNKEKPVDLGSIVLHPLPYRANWKSILTKRFPWFGRDSTVRPNARTRGLG